MSATTAEAVDAGTLERIIEKATAAQRRLLVGKLLPGVSAEDGYVPRLVHNARGELIGALIPTYRSTATEPPRLTPEERAELQRRLDTPDDTISYEQLLKDLGLTGVPLPRPR